MKILLLSVLIASSYAFLTHPSFLLSKQAQSFQLHENKQSGEHKQPEHKHTIKDDVAALLESIQLSIHSPFATHEEEHPDKLYHLEPVTQAKTTRKESKVERKAHIVNKKLLEDFNKKHEVHKMFPEVTNEVKADMVARTKQALTERAVLLEIVVRIMTFSHTIYSTILYYIM